MLIYRYCNYHTLGVFPVRLPTTLKMKPQMPHWMPMKESEVCGFKTEEPIDICVRPKVKVKKLPMQEGNITNSDEPKTGSPDNEIDLYLTAPIITAWTYQLADGLHKGRKFKLFCRFDLR